MVIQEALWPENFRNRLYSVALSRVLYFSNLSSRNDERFIKCDVYNVKIMAFTRPVLSPFLGLSTLTVITTTVTTPIISMAAAAATHHPALTTQQPHTSRSTTTAAPMTTAPFQTSTTMTPATMTPAFRLNPANLSGAAIRPCDLHSCLYGGTCEDSGSDFKCICPAGRGGKVCEKGELPGTRAETSSALS